MICNMYNIGIWIVLALSSVLHGQIVKQAKRLFTLSINLPIIYCIYFTIDVVTVCVHNLS